MPRHFRKPIPGDATDPESLTALLEQYLLWMETHHYAQGTVAIRRITLSKFLRWCHDRTVAKAKEATREMVERYQRHLFYCRKGNGEPLSVSSQAHWLTALRSWFAWMARQRLINHWAVWDSCGHSYPHRGHRIRRQPWASGQLEHAPAFASSSPIA